MASRTVRRTRRPTPLPETIAGGLAFQRVYRVPSRNWDSDAFKGAIGSGQLASAPPERVTAIAATYGMLNGLAQGNGEEVQLAASLGSLQFPINRTSTTRSAILSTLAQLDQFNFLSRVNAEQFLKQLQRIRAWVLRRPRWLRYAIASSSPTGSSKAAPNTGDVSTLPQSTNCGPFARLPLRADATNCTSADLIYELSSV